MYDGNQIIFLATHDGKAIRYEEDDVRPMGRQAYGVRGMNLERGDYIVGMAVTPKERKKAKDAEADQASLILPLRNRATASAPTLTNTACNRAAVRA